MQTEETIGRQSDRAQKNHQVVTSLYEDLRRGDVASLVNALSDRMDWVVAAGLPYGGRYRGREGVADAFARINDAWQELAVLPAEIIAVGDLVIALGHYRGRGRATGMSMESRFVHLWRLEEGVPVAFETVADTRTMVDAMR